MKKQLWAFVLAICLMMGMNPIMPADAAALNGSAYTSGTLAQRLDTIINQGISSDVKPGFPAVTGTFPKGQLFAVQLPTRSWRGYQCIAYAYATYNYLFDADPYGADTVCFSSLVKRNSLNYQDFVNSGVRCGAYLRTTCNSDGSYHSSKGHSIIILHYDSSNVTYLEANTSGNVYRVNLKTCSWSTFNRTLFNGRYVNTLRQPAESVYNTLIGANTSPDTSTGHWEYRYVGYATSDGKHECWCETYLKNKFGSASLRYSDWSSARYSPNGSNWTCGLSCKGSHTGIAKYGSKGAPYWAEYTLPDGKNYYWEESRWVTDNQSTENPAPTGHWGEWSEWSTTPAYAIDGVREVQTKQESRQVKVSDGYTEYRYGGYVTSNGRHECWCETYLKNKFGSANLRYSDWSTTRYSVNGSNWTCGSCNGNHAHVDHYGSDGRAWWPEYTLPDGRNFYWEESRTVGAQYETRTVTLYRYRDWISD